MEIRLDPWNERSVAMAVREFAESLGATVVLKECRIQDIPIEARSDYKEILRKRNLRLELTAR